MHSAENKFTVIPDRAARVRDDVLLLICPCCHPMETRPLRTFGRIKARTLKRRQAALVETLLPHLALPEAGEIELEALFSLPWRGGGVILEIGFGGGEHLVAQAAAHPDARFIGVEPFLNGIASCLRHIEESLLPLDGGGGRAAAGGGVRAESEGDASSGSTWHAAGLTPSVAHARDSSPIEGERARRINVRLHQGDARDVIARLPDACLDLVYILFPDPWPKTRHWKRRLIQREFLDELARVLKHGGEVRFATDWAHYAAWTLELFTRDPRFTWTAERASDWREAWPGHAPTRYEQKRLGDCAPIYLRFCEDGAI
jgi:tRNA (guanine-N7-)-methyltransferase